MEAQDNKGSSPTKKALGEVMDVLGFVAALELLRRNWKTIRQFLKDGSGQAAEAVARVQVWWHHDLVRMMRAWAVRAFLLNAFFTLVAALYVHYVGDDKLPETLSWSGINGKWFGAFALFVVGPFAVALLYTQKVKSAPWRRYTGMNVEDRRINFGPSTRSPIVPFFLLVGSLVANAVILEGVYLAVCQGAMRSEFAIVLTILAAVNFLFGLFAIVAAAYIVGTAVGPVGGNVSKIAGAFLRIALEAFPVIKAENYDQIIGLTSLPLPEFGEGIKRSHVTPLIALGLQWSFMLLTPSLPLDCIFLGLVAGSGVIEYIQRKRRIDTLPGIQRTLKIYGGVWLTAMILRLFGGPLTKIIDPAGFFDSRGSIPLPHIDWRWDWKLGAYLGVILLMLGLLWTFFFLAEKSKWVRRVLLLPLVPVSIYAALVVVVAVTHYSGTPADRLTINGLSLKEIDAPRAYIATAQVMAFDWEQADGAMGYRVERQAPGQETFVPVSGAENLSKETTHWETDAPKGEVAYRLCSLHADHPLVRVMKDTRIIVVTPAHVRLFWEPVPRSVGSRLERRKPGDAAFTEIGTVAGGVTHWEDPEGLPPGEYFYRSTAFYAGGWSSDPSPERRVLIGEHVPPVPDSVASATGSPSFTPLPSPGNLAPFGPVPPIGSAPSAPSHSPVAASGLKRCDPSMPESWKVEARNRRVCL